MNYRVVYGKTKREKEVTFQSATDASEFAKLRRLEGFIVFTVGKILSKAPNRQYRDMLDASDVRDI